MTPRFARWSAIARAVTPAGDAALGFLMAIAYLCGGPIWRWLLDASRVGGVTFTVSSPLDGERLRLATKAVLAMLPGIAWILAALRAVRSGASTGVAGCCVLTAILTGAASSAVLVRLHGVRSLLSRAPRDAIPIAVQVSELDYWATGLAAAAIAAVAAAIWILRRRRK